MLPSFRRMLGVGALTLVLALAALPTRALAIEPGSDVLDVGIGQSVIKRDTRAIARVLISAPEIAELRLLEEGQYQVRGLSVGASSW